MIDWRVLLVGAATGALAACVSEPVEEPVIAEEAMLECALDHADVFVRECHVEIADETERLYLLVHHPDGSFRRLELMADGSGLVSADGADLAQVQAGDGIALVTISGDQYRIPDGIGRDGSL